MISRFFSNAMPRRFLCLLLALLTCFCALSPALVQPAEAVAVADDVLIASLGLLAASWAGITFTTNAGANTAISNLLESKPVVKASLAGLITKNLVVDGAKLLLTSDVRDAFKTVLPEIKAFFQVDSASVSSSGVGSLVGPAVVGASYSCFSTTNKFIWLSESDKAALAIFPFDSVSSFLLSYDGISFTFKRTTSGYSVYSDDKYIASFQCASGHRFGIFCAYDNGLTSRPCFFWIDAQSSGSTFLFDLSKLYPVTSIAPGAVPVISILQASDSIPFHQSKEVDGTSALEILRPAPPYVVDPGGSTDPSEPSKPEVNFDYVSSLSIATIMWVMEHFGDKPDSDPGIDPDKMIEELKKAMEQSQENPDPEPDPDPTEEPDSGDSSDSFDYNKFKLPDLFTIFPFCIPFDLLAFMKVLSADPVAPSFTFATSFLGQLYTVNVDLSAWNGVASTLRYMVVAIYVVSLAVATRKFIKW